MTKYKVGKVIPVSVSGVTEYGIFTHVDNEYSGLIHISEISEKFVPNPHLFVKNDERIYAEILEVDEINKQLKLSIKNIQYRNKGIKRKKIIETKHGFDTLLYKLPFWIDENVKNHENELISIDKNSHK